MSHAVPSLVHYCGAASEPSILLLFKHTLCAAAHHGEQRLRATITLATCVLLAAPLLRLIYSPRTHAIYVLPQSMEDRDPGMRCFTIPFLSLFVALLMHSRCTAFCRSWGTEVKGCERYMTGSCTTSPASVGQSMAPWHWRLKCCQVRHSSHSGNYLGIIYPRNIALAWLYRGVAANIPVNQSIRPQHYFTLALAPDAVMCRSHLEVVGPYSFNRGVGFP